MTKWLAILLCLILLSACQTQSNNTQSVGKYTITDSVGRETSFDAPPEKVVVLTPAVVEIFYYLGEQDRLHAVGTYANFPEEAQSLPKVTAGNETNIEHIISLKPDCVIMSLMDQKVEDAELIANASIPVVVISPQTIEEVYWAIETTGELLGKKEYAIEKTTEIKEKMAKIAQAGKDQAQKTVYFEVSPLEYGIFTTGKETFINEIIELVGAKNIFDDLNGWCQVSVEQILSRNPDVILSTCSHYGIPDIKAEITARQGWGNITANKTGEIYALDGDLVTRPGPRIYEAAKKVYEVIYGEYNEN